MFLYKTFQYSAYTFNNSVIGQIETCRGIERLQQILQRVVTLNVILETLEGHPALEFVMQDDCVGHIRNDFRVLANKCFQQFFESLEILSGRGYLKSLGGSGVNFQGYTLSANGFEEYAQVFIEDYASLVGQKIRS